MSINLGVWEDFRNQIRTHLNNNDINSFFTWPIIVNTMVAGVDEAEITSLEQSKYWNEWLIKIDENVLKPDSHHKYPQSSRNNLHHAYSLDILMNNIDKTLDQFNTIIEFGGGYGNTCRLIKKWQPNCDYYIYDIQELIKIQENYLKQNNVLNYTLLTDMDKIESPTQNSLFIGLWSISETPVSERNDMLTRLKFFECDTIFLAMGGTFYNENNLDWLNNEIIPKLENYDTKLIRIPHGNEMYYFIANKK